jgi:betaine-homocysteine S-methyltransferase
VAAQPVPYKTHPASATFESLHTRDGYQAFPLALEPFLCNRFEMADFARKAQQMGVNYIGICCGGAPHYVRAMAEALGKTVPASTYSPAMELHPMLGVHVENKDKEFLADWKG